jgi:hypothetical protein
MFYRSLFICNTNSIFTSITINQILSECINIILSLSDKSKISKELIEIAKIISLNGNNKLAYDLVKKSLKFSYLIGGLQRVYILVDISIELLSYGKLKESNDVVNKSKTIALGLKDSQNGSHGLKAITLEFANRGDLKNAEDLGCKIPLHSVRQECWIRIAEMQKVSQGWKLAVKNGYELKFKEAQTFYFKGWAESISVNDICDELAHKALHALMNDSASLEHFLQVYALHELFFNNPSQEKIDRLNKTLNLQWVLDIIAQFPKADLKN